ncbi:unnamed protein product [Rotaria sordida]|uniref:Uncharacterized protein n=1 Tax=Rotaria sordida TaxID=392033 RepID=A0A813SVI6_9BILA|nr:unnamed protein product [Rotaria sordida]
MENIIKEEPRRRTTIYLSDIHVKNVDYFQPASTMISSSNTHETEIHVDKFHQTEDNDNEKIELTTLNNHFENYLNKIKILANININLRHEIVNILQTYMGHMKEEKQNDNNNNSNSSEIEFNNLRRQLNNELQKLISIQTRLQRADYDTKYYKNKVKLFSKSNQYEIIQQQLNVNLYELNLLKEQFEKQQESLLSYKRQYNEYMLKLIEYTNEYNKIAYERMQNENSLYTLNEQLLFEHEYSKKCQEEFEQLEKIQYDLNNEFNKTEFKKIIEKIRQDYESYNEIQVSELELFYKTKIDLMQNNFQENESENHSEEIKHLEEQNQSLEKKLKQLKNELHHISEQNQQQYELSYNEYHQLQIQVSDIESLILDLRNNTIQLSSEINTYRCLLTNLVSSFQQTNKPSSHRQQANNIIFHFRNGLLYVRI